MNPLKEQQGLITLKNFEKLYNEYAVKLKKFLICLTSDPELSEDLMQETFYQAYKSIHRYNGSCQMITWLCQIGKHCYYDYLKKAKHYPICNIEDVKYTLKSSLSVEEDYIINETVKDIRKISGELKNPYGEILILHLFGEMSYCEIAEIYGKSENWVRVTYYRAKQKLRKRLEEDGYCV